VLAALAYTGDRMSIDLRHHQLVQIIAACIKDGCTLAETLWVCGSRIPDTTIHEMRKALRHVRFFNLDEAEAMLPQWKILMARPDVAASRQSFARAIKGIDD
jgi:hypothetical protein